MYKVQWHESAWLLGEEAFDRATEVCGSDGSGADITIWVSLPNAARRLLLEVSPARYSLWGCHSESNSAIENRTYQPRDPSPLPPIDPSFARQSSWLFSCIESSWQCDADRPNEGIFKEGRLRRAWVSSWVSIIASCSQIAVRISGI